MILAYLLRFETNISLLIGKTFNVLVKLVGLTFIMLKEVCIIFSTYCKELKLVLYVLVT